VSSKSIQKIHIYDPKFFPAHIYQEEVNKFRDLYQTLTTSFPQTPAIVRVGVIYSDQKLTLIKIVIHFHTIESLLLRRPQLLVHFDASATPHPLGITSERTKVNFYTKDSSTSEASLSQVIPE